MDDRLLGNHTPRALTRCLSRVTLLTLCISMVLALLAAAPAASAAGSQFFPQTGHAVSGPFMAYWQAHGGLPIFGYPISDAQNEADPGSGKTALVQWFERARFELHPEFAGTPYEVELGLLGNQLAKGRQGQAPFEPIAPFASTPDRVFFPETSHALSGSFYAYWAANGGLPIFGYPISEAFPEANPADGQVYTVQYFERARFEAHPANPPAYQVELGLLGSQFMPSAPASQQVAITVSGGASQVTIAPDQTALMPPGTAEMVVAVQFPQPIDPASIQVQIRQLAGPDAWQLAPTGRMPTRSGYSYANTVAVNVTTGDVASDAGAGKIFYQVPTVIVARQTDGATQRFYGCYLLHRVNVEIGNTTPPYPIALRAAHIVAAPADADTAALLDQANALVQAGQCGQYSCKRGSAGSKRATGQLHGYILSGCGGRETENRGSARAAADNDAIELLMCSKISALLRQEV